MKTSEIFVMTYYVLEIIQNFSKNRKIKKLLNQLKPFVFNQNEPSSICPEDFKERFLNKYPNGKCNIEEAYEFISDYIDDLDKKVKPIANYLDVEDFKFATSNIIEAMEA